MLGRATTWLFPSFCWRRGLEGAFTLDCSACPNWLPLLLPLLPCPVVREQSSQWRNCLSGISRSNVFLTEFGPRQGLRGSLGQLQATSSLVGNCTTAGEFEALSVFLAFPTLPWGYGCLLCTRRSPRQWGDVREWHVSPHGAYVLSVGTHIHMHPLCAWHFSKHFTSVNLFHPHNSTS